MLIYLIGYMGSGKTTVGKKLAGQLGFSFIDLDTRIEEKYHTSIPDLFKRFDEKAFRLLEKKVLEETLGYTNTVVSTGGGTPCFFGNMDKINHHGLAVYIKMNPQSLLKRIINAKKKRPLIDQKPPDKIFKIIEDQLTNREVFYNQAKIITKGENIDIAELSEKIKSLKEDSQSVNNENQ